MMLLTPVEELSNMQMQEKKNLSILIGNIRKKIEYDHLPFANKVLKIAETLKDAPPKPSFELSIKQE